MRLIVNMKEWFAKGPLLCETKEAAEAWFEQEVALVRASTGIDADLAETVIREHLGYATGYCDIATARRMYEWWGAVHPLFGTPDERERLTVAEIEAIGTAARQILDGRVKAKA